jgi:hypothetical protein
MDSRRVAGVTCGAFGVRLSHLQSDFFHARRERQQIPMFPSAASELAFIGPWGFSHMPEVRPVTVHRYCPALEKDKLITVGAGRFGCG